MKVAALILLVSISGIIAAEYADEKGVLVLTDDNISDALTEFNYILVEFCEYRNFVGGVIL